MAEDEVAVGGYAAAARPSAADEGPPQHQVVDALVDVHAVGGFKDRASIGDGANGLQFAPERVLAFDPLPAGAVGIVRQEGVEVEIPVPVECHEAQAQRPMAGRMGLNAELHIHV